MRAVTRKQTDRKSRITPPASDKAPTNRCSKSKASTTFSDQMRAVVETEWRELVHKLPPKSPQRYGTIRAAEPETQGPRKPSRGDCPTDHVDGELLSTSRPFVNGVCGAVCDAGRNPSRG